MEKSKVSAAPFLWTIFLASPSDEVHLLSYVRLFLRFVENFQGGFNRCHPELSVNEIV